MCIKLAEQRSFGTKKVVARNVNIIVLIERVVLLKKKV